MIRRRRPPPTSPSTVADNTRDDRRAVDNDTYSAPAAVASGVFALCAAAGAAAGAGAPTGANNEDRLLVDRLFRLVDRRLLLG